MNNKAKEGLALISQIIKAKTKDSRCSISQAYYSAIHFYKQNEELKIHAGANIDPSRRELLKIKEHRNCAEKQAALSAIKIDKLSNPEMHMMFLYRRKDPARFLAAEKLLPCPDCYQRYIKDLIKNNGYLVLIVDDAEKRNFFSKDGFDSSIKSIEINKQKIFYKIFNKHEMSFLNIEKTLGASAFLPDSKCA